MHLLWIFALQMCTIIKGEIILPTRDYRQLLKAEEGTEVYMNQDASNSGNSSFREETHQEKQDFFNRILRKTILGNKLDPLRIHNYTTSSTWVLITITTTFYDIAICGLSSARRSGPNFIRADENGTRVRLDLMTDELRSTVYANVTALLWECSMKIILEAKSLSVKVALAETMTGKLEVTSFEAKMKDVRMEFTEIGDHSSVYETAKSQVESSIKTLLTTDFNATIYKVIKTQVERLNTYVYQHTTAKL
uniref:Putative glycine rich protein n=1 Tax=Ixodes ricinus TaxID=34613 RepID=A0A0K8RGB5_IXORI